VLFTANDLEIVAGGPSVRRAYLDTTITQLDRRYYGALSRYAHVLQQRNATLRRIKDGIAGPDELTFWDESLAREGAVIVAARQRAVTSLARDAAATQRELSGAAAEELSLAYEPRLGEEWTRLLTPDATPEHVEPLLAAALASQRRKDMAAGVSLTGPHRDDLSIKLNGVAAASFASRAQMRTIALSLRLAEARLLAADVADPPVLLLDDIVSELDRQRRASVLSGIAAFDQAWFTATEAEGLPPEFVESCAVYRVAGGTITPLAAP
jgi:DNA replication and repair protein RecF